MIDPTYAGDALVWLLVWGAAGYAGRRLLAQADQRKAERHARAAGKVIR